MKAKWIDFEQVLTRQSIEGLIIEEELENSLYCAIQYLEPFEPKESRMDEVD